MLLPLTTVAILVAFAIAKSQRDPRSGLRLGLCVWGVALLLTAVPFFTYAVDYSLEVDAFIAACLLSLAVCYRLCRASVHLEAPRNYQGRNDDLFVGKMAGYIGIVGNLLLLYGAVSRGVEISPSFFLQNIGTINRDTLDLAAGGGISGPYLIVGSLLAPGSYLHLILATRLPLSKRLTWTNFTLIVFVALFYYGARQTIIVAVVLILVAFWLRHVKIFRLRARTVVLVLVFCSVGWYFTTTFATQRQGETDPEYLLHVTGRAEYQSSLRERAQNNPVLGSSLLQYSYFSSPIPSLFFYMQSPQAPAPLWGEYSFPLPYLIGRTVLFEHNPNAWQEARRKVFVPFSSAGFLDNAWATGLRDLYADFGYVGAIVFYGLLGAFLAWARNMFERTGRALYHALETYGTVIFAFGAFQSLLYAEYVTTGAFIAWGLVLIQVARRPRASRRQFAAGEHAEPG